LVWGSTPPVFNVSRNDNYPSALEAIFPVVGVLTGHSIITHQLFGEDTDQGVKHLLKSRSFEFGFPLLISPFPLCSIRFVNEATALFLRSTPTKALSFFEDQQGMK